MNITDALIRLAVAIVLSGVVGVERYLSGKPAGVRTYMLVGMGVTLFLIVAQMSGLDVGRVSAGVITGVGFLGAGAIIRQQGEVLGLTTAASIWAVAGIGIAVARGLWVLAIVVAFTVLIILWGLEAAEQKFGKVLKNRRHGHKDK